MAYLIGTDEAGYGPNLGPLVISATLWKVPEKLLGKDLYPCLAPAIVGSLALKSGADSIAIADSKQLYHPGGGLEALERGLLSMLRLTGQPPSDWRDIWKCLDAGSLQSLNEIPWYSDYESPLPIDASHEELDALASRVGERCQDVGIQCQRIQSTVVFPAQLNDGIQQYGNKATVLSLRTLSLAESLMRDLGDEPIMIHCDKHGGRNKYGPMLQQVFPGYLFQVACEGRQQSVYRWGPPQRPIEIQFVAKGESCLASALGSMASKYLRELAMRAFNHFWTKRVPGIRPTAGYPVDAKRFREEIADAQRELEIADWILWRNK